MTYSGVVHFIAENDDEAAFICRRLLSFLPSNNLEDPPRLAYDGPLDPDPGLNNVVPDDGKLAYDMRSVIAALLDQGDFLEVQLSFAQNILIGFGRIAGRPVGVIANQPSVMAGALDINASDKAARFIRFCNAFNIPLLTLVDVPGFMPGVQQEYGGIIRHGAKLLFAYSAATVPKVTVIVRKAYGGAYLAMCGKDLGADRVVAWPTALYRNTFSNPYVAGGTRLVDDIIEPAQTRRYLAMALEALQTKRELRPAKKHGLMPL
jgi:methylmalonyl-CoA carboxyltransferase large subunit